jgi:hypothetical protein
MSTATDDETLQADDEALAWEVERKLNKMIEERQSWITGSFAAPSVVVVISVTVAVALVIRYSSHLCTQCHCRCD